MLPERLAEQRVVGREQVQLGVAHAVETAVADVRPPGALLRQGADERDHRSAHGALSRRIGVGLPGGEHALIGIPDRALQGQRAVGGRAAARRRTSAEQRAPEARALSRRLALIGRRRLNGERGADRLDGELARDLPLGAPAHAVGDDEQLQLGKTPERVLVRFAHQSDVGPRPGFQLHLRHVF